MFEEFIVDYNKHTDTKRLHKRRVKSMQADKLMRICEREMGLKFDRTRLRRAFCTGKADNIDDFMKGIRVYTA